MEIEDVPRHRGDEGYGRAYRRAKEEAEGTIVSDPNADAPDIDDVADVNENESNNEIEE